MAKRLLGYARAKPYVCGDTGLIMGYWVESHTIGCRNEAGDEDIWAAHYAIWDEYSKDGKSILIGDPADGVFVSITPRKEHSATMGAEMLIELGRRVKKTMPLKVGDEIAARVEEDLSPFVNVALVAGSVRRRRPEIGDVELVVLPKDLGTLLSHLQGIGFTGGDRIQKGIVHAGPGKYAARVPVEIYIAHKPEELGAMLFMYTGDFVHNISMRSIAKRAGWKLDQYGIFDAKTGKPLLQSPDERDFYDFLGVDWHDPEDRSFKDRSKKKSKKATMGAEMLIELGRNKRKTGYIHLELISPGEEETDSWVLRVERMDPFGGAPWIQDFPFEDESVARSWFKGIVGDEDLDALIAQTSS